MAGRHGLPPPHKHVLVPQVSVELPLLLPSSEESLTVSIVTCLTWLYSAPVLEAWWGRAAWERQAAADAMEALGAVLSCPVCVELFTPAVLLLSCSHNFCKQCLELILTCQNCTHSNGQFCCPVCRKVREAWGPSAPEIADFFLVITSWIYSITELGIFGLQNEDWLARTHISGGLSGGGWGEGLEDMVGPRAGATGRHALWFNVREKVLTEPPRDKICQFSLIQYVLG